MSQKKELAKNTLILAVGKLSTQFVSFLLLPLYTFFLSPAEFGIVDLLITYTALLAPLATLQLEMAAFRFLVDARADEAQKKRIISNIMHIVAAAIALLAVVFMAVNLFVAIPHGFLMLAIGIVAILLSLFMQIARGLGQNKAYAIASIAIALTNIAATLGLVVVAKLGIQGVLGAMLCANTMGLLYIFWKLRLRSYMTFRAQDAALKKELVHYSWPLVPNGISWWVISLFDRTIIAIFLGVASNGIYAVSSKYATIFTSIFSIFGMSWTESASVHIKDNPHDRQAFFSDVFATSIRVFGSLGLLLIAALPLVFGIIDQQYAEAYKYIPILIVGAFFNFLVGLYSAIYVARKMTKQVMATSLIAAAINIALNFMLISFIGLYAAALATATAYGAMAIYRHFDLKSFVSIQYEKHILLFLVGITSMVIHLYYLDMPLGNGVNVVLVVLAAIFLNQALIRALLRKLKRS